MTRLTLPVRLAQAWLAAATAYLLALLGLAARARRRPAAAPVRGDLRIVVLVPAHDEAPGVAGAVRALLAQDLPGRVVVIADNCTDDTAAVARAAGAEVWERDAPDARGKGQALAWAIERLWASGDPVDAVAVVDADCIAEPGLLRAFAAAFGAGAPAVQADYRVANPEASGAAARRWAGFALMHAVRGGGKAAAGLSCGLYGTGMAFRADVLRELPWTSFSVTEDAEHHVRLVEHGHVVAFAPSAAVLSPMPLTEADAEAQQLRWESGKAALVRTTVPRLLRRGLRGDVQALHTGLEQLVPPQSLLLAGSGAGLVVGVLARDRALARLATATVAGQVAFVLGGLAVADAPPPVWRALATAPVTIARKVAQAARISSGGGATDWVRTTRD